MLNGSPLISVMIPIYNSEKYLVRCLNSILNQSYTNLEIILVNDGSNDNSLAICEQYRKSDSRIVLINKANEGASQARNVALKRATGDYYGFVDSDDWVFPNYFEKLLIQAKEKNADISRCQSTTSEDEDVTPQKIEIKTMYKQEFMPLILTDRISSHLWKNIFKKELFKDIYFPENYSAHDMRVFHKIANRAENLVETNEKLYYYYENRPDNMSNNPKGMFKGTIGRAMAFYERYMLAETEYPEVEEELLKKVVRYTIASFCRAENSVDSIYFKEELLTLENFLFNKKKVIKNSASIILGEKIAVNLILLNSKIFMRLIKYFNL